MAYWLMKSEPDVFSIDDLAARPGRRDYWDGVRNYQARNMMRDQMRKGDQVFFYHSNCEHPGIVGIAEVVREGYVDHTAFDSQSPYHDPKSNRDDPRWYMVDIRFVRKLARDITLQELKGHLAGKLQGFQLLQRGNRLSVMPVSEAHWQFILSLE
jgi:predicted RNA-binding protein with PUA-like domain